MKKCRFVKGRNHMNHTLHCGAPGKAVNGSVRCADHWPRVVS